MTAKVQITKSLNLEVVGNGTIHSASTILSERGVDYILLGTLEGAGPASIRSLMHALERWLRRKGGGKFDDERIWVGLSTRSEADFRRRIDLDSEWIHDQYEGTPPTSPAIYLCEGVLRVRISMKREDEPDREALSRSITPFLKRLEASCEMKVEKIPPYEGRGYVLSFDFDRTFPRGSTVADAWRLGDEAHALLAAVEGEDLPPSAAVDLLCAGRWNVFRGQPESDWLEAKGAPYDHLLEELGKNWKYELAKDVAAFANSPDGGIIVLGMTTKDLGGGEIITGYKEFDLKRVRASTYRKHVAQLVYPRVEGLEVKRIEGSKEGQGLAVIVIPPQAESSWPFLVQGALSERKVLGSHVLLPVRREDDTAFLDAGALHARLRLGEQVIGGRSSSS